MTKSLQDELRRLQVENEELLRDVNMTNEIAAEALFQAGRLESQRDKLLKALKMAVRQNEHDMIMTGEECRQCRDAIAKAEDEQ